MKYFLFILGCQMNIADSNRLRQVLNSCGLKETDEKSADLIVVVACSVREKPVQRIWGKIRNWQKAGQKIWLTGCILPADKKKFAKKVDRIFPINEMIKIPQLLSRTTNYRLPTTHYLEICQISSSKVKIKNSKLLLDKNIKSSLSAYSLSCYLLPIMTGCNNFCSYCAVPYCRGREISRPIASILKEAKAAICAGYKEILLLGQNVNSYRITNSQLQISSKKKQKKSDFVKLLKKIEKLPGNFKFNFLTSHPKDFGRNLIDFLAKSKKWTHQLHLPLQSGSGKILKLMNRKYNSAQFLDLISKLKIQIPKISISTDIIVGFPGETKKDFEKTLAALKIIKPTKVYVAQFSPRPGTAAAKLKDNVPPAEKKRRWNIINQKYNKN